MKFVVRKCVKCQIFGKEINKWASFRETCQWLKFPLIGLRDQSRVSPVVGLLPLASGQACLGMAFPALLVKQLYGCDSVVTSSFVTTGYTTRRWGWLLGRIGYSITPHLPRVMKHYCPTGRRNLGRPLKRLLDTWDRNGPTSGPAPWKIWWWWWWLLINRNFVTEENKDRLHSGNFCWISVRNFSTCHL